MRSSFVWLGRRLIARKEAEEGRPLTPAEQNRIALLMGLPLFLFALFCFYMAR